jgi:arylsulfatase A-like enzyme
MFVLKLGRCSGLLGITAAAVLAGGGCGLSTPEPPTNLIVISVDTLRADHMSLYGYPRPTTPAIDAFAQTAVTFDHARAPWPKTVPSMVSMFTSRPPHATGVMFGSRDQYVSDEELLLAEIAADHGLRTAAVVSNGVLGAATNFGQGFETYTETYKLIRGPMGFRADTVTAAAEQWLRARQTDEPFFLWVHYVDPHATYVPPEESAASFLEDDLYDATLLRLNEDDNNFDSGVAGRYWRRNGSQQEKGWYIANYDGEIAYTDAMIGRLLNVVDERGFLANSLIVLTADHGESLGEHRYFFEHGWYPYNASAWVPFVVYWPGMPDPGRRVTYPVSLIHLVPTVVDLMDWEVEDPRFHGTSLTPVMRGEQERVDDYVVVEAGEGGLRPHEFLSSIEDSRWKLLHIPNERYQRQMQGMEYELYEVRVDPMETQNVVSEHPELVELMKTLLETRVTSSGPTSTEPGRLPNYSPEEIENLRSLGYIR